MCGRRGSRGIFIQTGLGHGGYGFVGSPCCNSCIPYNQCTMGNFNLTNSPYANMLSGRSRGGFIGGMDGLGF